VVVHHTRKTKDDSDPFKDVSGSSGLVGAADAVLVLERGRNTQDVQVHVTGRDVEETIWPLTFDASCGRWTVSGDPPWMARMGDTRRQIYGYLHDNGGSSPAEIAAVIPGLLLNTVQKTMRRMASDGHILSDGSGRYRAPSVSSVSSVSVQPSMDDGTVSSVSSVSVQPSMDDGTVSSVSSVSVQPSMDDGTVSSVSSGAIVKTCG